MAMPSIRFQARCGVAALLLLTAAASFGQGQGHTCAFDATSTQGMNFGALNPSAAALRTATASVAVGDCVSSQTMSVTVDNGQNFSGGTRNLRRVGGTELIPYSVSAVTIAGGSGGPGPNKYKAASFTGAIQAAGYIDAVAGDYLDTLVVSVTP
jgi:spore coat protein U-like protein